MGAKIQRESLKTVQPKHSRPSGVQFASTAEENAAADLGVSADKFEGAEPSSANGFTVADVKRIADE